MHAEDWVVGVGRVRKRLGGVHRISGPKKEKHHQKRRRR